MLHNFFTLFSRFTLLIYCVGKCHIKNQIALVGFEHLSVTSQLRKMAPRKMILLYDLLQTRARFVIDDGEKIP